MRKLICSKHVVYIKAINTAYIDLTYKQHQQMIRKLSIATFYSAIIFCMVSYASVMEPLLSSTGSLYSMQKTVV